MPGVKDSKKEPAGVGYGLAITIGMAANNSFMVGVLSGIDSDVYLPLLRQLPLVGVFLSNLLLSLQTSPNPCNLTLCTIVGLGSLFKLTLSCMSTFPCWSKVNCFPLICSSWRIKSDCASTYRFSSSSCVRFSSMTFWRSSSFRFLTRSSTPLLVSSWRASVRPTEYGWKSIPLSANLFGLFLLKWVLRFLAALDGSDFKGKYLGF